MTADTGEDRGDRLPYGDVFGLVRRTFGCDRDEAERELRDATRREGRKPPKVRAFATGRGKWFFEPLKKPPEAALDPGWHARPVVDPKELDETGDHPRLAETRDEMVRCLRPDGLRSAVFARADVMTWLAERMRLEMELAEAARPAVAATPAEAVKAKRRPQRELPQKAAVIVALVAWSQTSEALALTRPARTARALAVARAAEDTAVARLSPPPAKAQLRTLRAWVQEILDDPAGRN